MGEIQKKEHQFLQPQQHSTTTLFNQKALKEAESFGQIFNLLGAITTSITNILRDHRQELVANGESTGELLFMIVKLLCADAAKLKSSYGKRTMKHVEELLGNIADVIDIVDVAATFGGPRRQKTSKVVRTAQGGLAKLCKQFGFDLLVGRFEEREGN
eukprot:gnl/Chilomastix_caulleri/2418.p1 GENE.gnl/Chilomastix_caulleri/2418~~gnl/Chilomastix_caulleri/2418.p1  ORF type:complete len:158 (+),score=10.92 gnl/Chilomastix_caulleri/2418:70-543(+)